MRHSLVNKLGVPLAVASAWGCGESGSGNLAGTSGSAGHGGTGSAAASPCETYIDCVAQTAPAGLAAALAAYGQSGTCWLEDRPELCEEACFTATVSAHQAFPDASACNICRSSDDCPGTLPGCDAAAGRCVQCLDDSHCGTTAPACHTAEQRCVECTGDSHCSDPFLARCDVPAERCVSCLSDVDCDDPYLPVCDPGGKHCRGCQTDAECAPGVCAIDRCVECRTNADCPGATPRCNAMGSCVPCVEDSDCAPGICHPLLNFCCGATACADQGAQCGYAIDSQCPLLPMKCGECTTGNVCDGGSCTPAPPNNCAILNCSTGRCGYVPDTNSYQCLEKWPACSETNSDCGEGYRCQKSEHPVTLEWIYYCVQYCVTNADCPGNGSCDVDPAFGYGTCP